MLFKLVLIWYIFKAISGAQIDQIYVFGDSLCDTGNLFRLTNKTKPDPKYYYEGRSSNGPLWTEVAAYLLPSKPKLVSFAYGGATSDNIEFPAKEKVEVPGARQQMEIDFPKYYTENTNSFLSSKANSLVIYSFGGNDLFYPNVVTSKLVGQLEEGLSKFITKYNMPHVMVAVSLAIRFLPIMSNFSEPERSSIYSKSDQFKDEWGMRMNNLRFRFPNTTFYELKFHDYIFGMTQSLIPQTKRRWVHRMSCLTPKFETLDPYDYDVCPDPGNYIFWDDVHATAETHRLLGHYMVDTLNRKN